MNMPIETFLYRLARAKPDCGEKHFTEVLHYIVRHNLIKPKDFNK